MGRTYGLFLEDKAGRSRNVISPVLGPITEDFATRPFLVDGIEDASDIAKPVLRRRLLPWRPRFTFQERHAFSINGFENAFHLIGDQPEIVKKLPIDGGATERPVDEQPQRLRECREASSVPRRQQNAPPVQKGDIFHLPTWCSPKPKIGTYVIEFFRLWLAQTLVDR